MAYNPITNINGTDPGSIFTYIAGEVPIFIPMILFGLFCITALGSYFAQQRSTLRASFPASLAVAGYVTVAFSLVLTLIPGLINITTLGIVFAVAILSTAWLIIESQGRGI